MKIANDRSVFFLSLLSSLLLVGSVQAATFTVNTTSDAPDVTLNGTCLTAAGACSLRAALMEANNTPAADLIQFAIPAADSGCSGSGICTIVVSNATPQFVLEATQPVTIDGSTQPGNAGVCTTSIPNRPSYRVVLQGSGQEPGLRLAIGADNSTIRGLNLRGFNNAIAIIGASNAAIECNFIGTTENGTDSTAVNNGVGVLVGCRSQSVAIGGLSDNAGNLISDHGADGVQIIGDGCPPAQPSQISVRGNFIGTDKSGLTDLGNRFAGVSVFAATTPGMNAIHIGNVPSGANAGLKGNLISGNDSSGIYIAGEVDGVSVQGNLIGTNVSGNAAIANDFDAVFVEDVKCDSNDIPSNITIGSLTEPAMRNVLSGNAGDGVFLRCMPGSVVIGSNIIGLSQDTVTALPNRSGIRLELSSGVRIGSQSSPNIISRNTAQGVLVYGDSSAGNQIVNNAIFDNGALDIDLGNDVDADGRTPNDIGDADTGPNTLLNTPELLSRTLNAGQVVFTFRVNTDFSSNPMMQANFYLSDASGEGGRTLLGTMNVSANGTFMTPAFPAPGATATTTFVASMFALTSFDTSEFSLPIPESPLFANGFE